MYLEKIQKIISQKTGHDPEEIIPTTHFQEDLNIGELEYLEIISRVEVEYNVDLSDYKDDIETIEDLVKFLTEEIE